jgi:carbon monoxide dehydrogenase subunit G
MHYEGTIEAPVTRAKFYSFITDPKNVIGILPDVVGSNVKDPDHFSVKMKTGIAYLKGTVEADFSFAEKADGRRVKVAGRGQGMQSSLEITLEIDIEEAGASTKARWTTDLVVGGLLASVGGRLIDGVASKYVKRITDNLRAGVSA